MMNNQFHNTHTVLTELSGSLQKAGDAIDFYFNQFKEGEMLNPFLAEDKSIFPGSDDALPPEFFQGIGIQTLILDSSHGKLSLSEKKFTDMINRHEVKFHYSVLNNL